MPDRFKIIKIESADQGMKNHVKLLCLLLNIAIAILVILKANHNDWLIVTRSDSTSKVKFVIVHNLDLQQTMRIFSMAVNFADQPIKTILSG